jgi:hypothetical protein
MSPTKPTAQVCFVGWQTVDDGQPGFALYNIVSGPGLCVGSTVALRSLIMQGYTVELVPGPKDLQCPTQPLPAAARPDNGGGRFSTIPIAAGLAAMLLLLTAVPAVRGQHTAGKPASAPTSAVFFAGVRRDSSAPLSRAITSHRAATGAISATIKES